MDISSILWALLAGALALLTGGAIYYFLYKRHINKALAEPQRKHRRLPSPRLLFLVLTGLVLLLGTGFCLSELPDSDRLTKSQDILDDILGPHRDDWGGYVERNGQIAAGIAYNRERDEHSFAIYKNDGTGSYVFVHGGSSTSIARSVRVFRYEDMTALVSMNALQITAVESSSGERYKLSPTLPFVLILQGDSFTLYDRNGEQIDLTEDLWYELTEIH